MEFELYEHHGKMVWTAKEIKGRYKTDCLCTNGCQKFKPGQPDHCKIAAANYALCIEHNLVAPVQECPEFESPYDIILVQT